MRYRDTERVTASRAARATTGLLAGEDNGEPATRRGVSGRYSQTELLQ